MTRQITRVRQIDPLSRKLMNLGVSMGAVRTTFKREGLSEYTEFLEREEFMTERGHSKVIVFHPSPATQKRQQFDNAGYCDLVYNLFLKEAILLGNDKCRQLHLNDPYRYTSLVTEELTPLWEAFPIVASPIVFHPDFCGWTEVDPADHYRDRPRREEVERYIKRELFHEGISVVLKSNLPLDKIEGGWDKDFLRILNSNAVHFPITAPRDYI